MYFFRVYVIEWQIIITIFFFILLRVFLPLRHCSPTFAALKKRPFNKNIN